MTYVQICDKLKIIRFFQIKRKLEQICPRNFFKKMKNERFENMVTITMRNSRKKLIDVRNYFIKT